MAVRRGCLEGSERAEGGSESDTGMGMAGGFPVEEQNEGGKYIRLCGCRGRRARAKEEGRSRP